MPTNRRRTRNKDALSLTASEALSACTEFAVKPGGYVAIQGVIHRDTDYTLGPTDSVVGHWEIYASGDDSEFSLVPDTTAKLANIAPNGTTRVSSWAIFEQFPGTKGKLRFVKDSGTGTTPRATVNVVTDE